ncbi:glycosyltransferase [Mycobacterium sp. 94-17]|uniref:glycosyltransferase n=1 Tax=Mycobacterium sp. 94-17 TaxID=2986147 RepID=UPI002D1F83FA|nr:glycosyltransferase [Mycobacterium sp. 94-17]MEB4209235.1 glycosyltransferase [Mycobacterium sp. 94-17]
MKIVLAAHGTRGDVEPCAAVGLELLSRGHDVRVAVPPDLVGFVESAGLSASAYGPDSRAQSSALADFVHHAFTPQNPVNLVRAGQDLFVEGWAQMGRTLTSLAGGADLLATGQTYHGVVANVAEYYDIPLAAIHHMPICVNGQLALPAIPSPAPLVRSTLRAAWWLYARITKDADDTQRRELGLPRAVGPAARRMAERGTLEIQAYDAACFPGLAAEWQGRRPFVGALTLRLPTDADGEVATWIGAASPPIYFGFGSTGVQSPADTIATIVAACAELGERALIYCDAGESTMVGDAGDVKLVGPVNYATIFPLCRAAVHHGGAGTTAAALRAGIPMLILWDVADQPMWAAQAVRMKVGRAQRLSSVTRRALVTQLRRVLAPQYAARAGAMATRMTDPAESVAAAADLLEGVAVRKGVA